MKISQYMLAATCTAALLGTLAACGSPQREATPALAPTAAAPAQASGPQPSPVPLPPVVPPPPLAMLEVGTPDARDDLYCSAVIYNANPDVSDALAPVDEALLRKAQALGFIIGESGINKLVVQRAIHATQARAIADAYAVQVEKDAKAGATRISLDDCNKRAAAVPMPE